MHLVKSLATVNGGLDRVFQEFFWPASFNNGQESLDVIEDADSVRFLLDVPGYQEKDLDITLENGILTVKGEREMKLENQTFLYQERKHQFSRSLKVPRTLDAKEVKAELKDGVLTVECKKRENEKIKRIKIGS